MDYVIVDFEWNQSPYGKGTGKKKLPFEIIEIGAVKLDENRNIIDTFDAVIQPKVYKKLHHMTQVRRCFHVLYMGKYGSD